MRRADRLFQIIQLLRGRRRAVTARWLAEKLEVSERTVYRDIRDMAANGTPIEGAAGVGYTLRAGYDLPPLMFDAEEIEALVLGARLAAAVGDPRLARAASSVISKVHDVLPPRLKPKVGETALFALRRRDAPSESEELSIVRAALSDRRRLVLHYERADGASSERAVRPLGAFLWGDHWVLTGWCELREDFRNFRLDRMRALTIGAPFDEEPGRTLRDFLRTIGPDAESILDA